MNDNTDFSFKKLKVQPSILEKHGLNKEKMAVIEHAVRSHSFSFIANEKRQIKWGTALKRVGLDNFLSAIKQTTWHCSATKIVGNQRVDFVYAWWS